METDTSATEQTPDEVLQKLAQQPDSIRHEYGKREPIKRMHLGLGANINARVYGTSIAVVWNSVDGTPHKLVGTPENMEWLGHKILSMVKLTKRDEFQHNVSVSPINSNGTRRAICACGWKGNMHGMFIEAAKDAANHEDQFA